MDDESELPFTVMNGSNEEIEKKLGSDMELLGMSKQELEERCNEIFGFTQPIPFKSSGRKAN